MSEEFNAKPVQVTPEQAGVTHESSTTASEDPSLKQGYQTATSQPPNPPTQDKSTGGGEAHEDAPNEGLTEQTRNAGESVEGAKAPPPDQDLPEQKHAGKVGLGPNYNQKPGFMDKITGLKEKIKGKILKKPELAEKGQDRMTGELKRKEKDEEVAKSPFNNAKADDSESPDGPKKEVETESKSANADDGGSPDEQKREAEETKV